MKESLVSIVIPTFNRAYLIQETVDSALSQTYDDLEIIILDNNSSDGSLKLLENLYSTNPKIQLYQNQTTLDIVKNWKKCFDFAKGEYVLILWSDDLIDPEFIERTASFLSENPLAGFVYTKTEIFNRQAGLSKEVFVLEKEGLIERDLFIRKSLLDPPLSVPVSPANSLFRRKDLQNYLMEEIPNNFGLTYSKIGQGNDNLLFLLALKDYKYFGYINKTLSHFRDHNKSITLSTNSFLVTMHYHIAKAYFISQVPINSELIKKYNAKIILIKWLCILTGVKPKLRLKSLYVNKIRVSYNPILVVFFLFKYIAYKFTNR